MPLPRPLAAWASISSLTVALASLSGGERQRVALAAALAHGPGLVIADEPTGELDAASADEVYDFLREHAERTGAALLVVTHDARAERVATRVVTIHDGRLSQESLDGRNSLVVDGRGWVRLPDALRADTGIAGRVVATALDGSISLVGSEAAGPPVVVAPVRRSEFGDVAVSVRRCRDRPRHRHHRARSRWSCDGARSR